jgi:hypothetical protein
VGERIPDLGKHFGLLSIPWRPVQRGKSSTCRRGAAEGVAGAGEPALPLAGARPRSAGRKSSSQNQQRNPVSRRNWVSSTGFDRRSKAVLGGLGCTLALRFIAWGVADHLLLRSAATQTASAERFGLGGMQAPFLLSVAVPTVLGDSLYSNPIYAARSGFSQRGERNPAGRLRPAVTLSQETVISGS